MSTGPPHRPGALCTETSRGRQARPSRRRGQEHVGADLAVKAAPLRGKRQRAGMLRDRQAAHLPILASDMAVSSLADGPIRACRLRYAFDDEQSSDLRSHSRSMRGGAVCGPASERALARESGAAPRSSAQLPGSGEVASRSDRRELEFPGLWLTCIAAPLSLARYAFPLPSSRRTALAAD